MSLREAMNKSPVWIGVGLFTAVLLAIAISIAGMRRAAPHGAVFATRAFYTTDDGATLFADDASLVPPFDHNGRQAVRAHVFSCGKGGRRWVQYLEKSSDSSSARKDSSGPEQPAGVLVKKPGSSEWVLRGTAPCLDVIVPKCPDGGDPKDIVMVFPKN